MMFPYISPYLHMMNRNRMMAPGITGFGIGGGSGSGSQASGRQTWNTGTGIGTGTPGHGPDDTDSSADGRRRGLNAGLAAAGIQILSGASSGDYGGSLARGAQAFTEAFAGSRDRDRQLERERREEERQAAIDARAERQDVRAAESHSLGMETGREQLDEVRERRRVAADIRARTGKGAAQMAADIQELAAAYPDNPKLQVMAQRAAGYAAGDEDDVDKLTNLHEQMTDEAFWQSDFDRGAAAKRAAEQADIAAGVKPDPKAAERRANTELGISQGHLALARERATQEKNDQTKQMTILQSFDRIQEIADRKLADKVAAWDERSNGRPVSEAQKSQWRLEALQEAQTEFRALISSSYQFTADGQLVR